jgi:hypothetical protein
MQWRSLRCIVGLSLAGALASAASASAQEDAATRLQLMGAVFAPPTQPLKPPSPGRTLASAFLPGRGVITWDVTGLTPEQAREAQIEAMGLADARAVQRQIDAEAAARAAQAQAQGRPARSTGLVLVQPSAQTLTSPRDGQAALVRARADQAGKGGLDPQALGVRPGEALSTRPRLYAFAAASGSGVGLNMLHDDDGGWRNAGLTTDRGGFTGQQQAGLAWRKGLLQTSLSYVSEKSRGDLVGVESEKDHRVMITTAMPTEALVSFISGR